MRADNVGAPVTPQQWNYIHEMGGALRSSLDNVSAVFAPSCIGHALLLKRDWVNIKIDDISLPSALRCWEHSTRPRRKRHDKLKRSTEATTTALQEQQHQQQPHPNANNQRHQRHRQRAQKLNNVAQAQPAPQRKRNHLNKEQREERKRRRQERQRRKQRRRQQQQQRKRENEAAASNSSNKNSNKQRRRPQLTAEQQLQRKQQRQLRRKQQLQLQQEQPSEPQKRRASNSANELKPRQRVPRVPEKCGLRLLERCSWPQCNHSCPTLTNPLTGEEMRFLELLTSFGLDIEAVAAALGVDMHTLNNMERTELVNLLTQQVS